MTGNPEIDRALDDLRGTVADLRGIVRRLRLWVGLTVAGVVLALVAGAALVASVQHSAAERDALRCAETVERSAAISVAITGAVDDVMAALAEQVDDPAAVEAIDRVHERLDRRLASRLDRIPEC